MTDNNDTRQCSNCNLLIGTGARTAVGGVWCECRDDHPDTQQDATPEQRRGPFGGECPCDPQWHGNDLGTMTYAERDTEPLTWTVCAYCRMPIEAKAASDA